MAQWDLSHWQMVARTIDAIVEQERATLTGDQSGAILHGCREAGWQAAHIREYIQSLATAPPGPPETPAPFPSTGRAELIGMRAVGANGRPQLWLGLSRFYWGHDWLYDRDRVLREMDADVAHGFDYVRVFAQVETIDSDTYWAGRETKPYEFTANDMVRMTTEAAQRGLRIAWTLIGKGGAFHRHDNWRAAKEFVRERTAALQEVPEGVLFIETMNEPGAAGGVSSAGELLELHAFTRHANGRGLILATGATFCGDGATAFSPHTWASTKGMVGVVHLDRSLGGHSEYPDRPWRQPWDVGLMNDPWVDGEAIGPGASVNSERDDVRLTGHRAVAFLCGAFASCLHGEPGIRGLIPWEDEPAYDTARRSKMYLPGDLANGRLFNANENFAGRPFDVSEDHIRAISGRGIIRAYTSEVGGTYHTIAFGMVSPFSLRARWDMRCWVRTQDGEYFNEVDVKAGDVLRFDEPLLPYRYFVVGSEPL